MPQHITSHAWQVLGRGRTIWLLSLFQILLAGPALSELVDQAWLPLFQYGLPLILLLFATRAETSLIMAINRTAYWEPATLPRSWQAGASSTWRAYALRLLGHLVGVSLGLLILWQDGVGLLILLWLLVTIPLSIVLDFAMRATILHDESVKQALITGYTLLRRHLGAVIWFTIGSALRAGLMYILVALIPAIVIYATGYQELFFPGASAGLQIDQAPQSDSWGAAGVFIRWISFALVWWLPTTWLAVVWTLFYRTLTTNRETETQRLPAITVGLSDGGRLS